MSRRLDTVTLQVYKNIQSGLFFQTENMQYYVLP